MPRKECRLWMKGCSLWRLSPWRNRAEFGMARKTGYKIFDPYQHRAL